MNWKYGHENLFCIVINECCSNRWIQCYD